MADLSLPDLSVQCASGSYLERMVVGCRGLDPQQENIKYARHDDGFSSDAAYDSGALEQAFSSRRNRLPQARPVHRSNHLRRLLSPRAAPLKRPYQTWPLA